MSQISTNPNVLGYWARTNGLSYTDVVADMRFASTLTAGYDQRIIAKGEFERGWKEADDELRAEALDTLFGNMADALTTGKGIRSS